MAKIAYGTSQMPYSPAVRAGDFVYVAGQIPTLTDGSVVVGGIEAQTRRTLENLSAALALAGATLADVVKTTVVLSDTRDFAAFNRAYAEFFPAAPPVRTTITAGLMIDIKVEIDAVAYCPPA